MKEELTSKQVAIADAVERSLKDVDVTSKAEEDPEEVKTTEVEMPTKDPPKKRSRKKPKTVKELVEAEVRKVLGKKEKKESVHYFYFAYKDEKNKVKTLDDLIYMRNTKLEISDLSRLYNDEEKEIIRIFKRKDKFNCLLIGDQVQMNDLVTKIQLKMEDSKDHYGIGEYFVFYMDANVFKKAIETTSVYAMVDALKCYFEGMKILLVINHFEVLVDSRTSQDQINAQITAKMLELFKAPNFRILATIDEEKSESSSYGQEAIESNFYTKELPESKYNQFRKFITPSIKRILNKNAYIEKDAMEKLKTYAGLYEYSNKFEQAYRLIEDAAIIAKEHRRKNITVQDFNDIFAEQFRQVNAYSKSVIHRISVHEAGHYIIYSYLKKKRFKLYDVVTVTVLPISGGALGFNQLSIDDPMLVDKKSADADVLVSLGGRAAEELFCNSMTDGCYGDLQQAVSIIEESLKYGVFDDNQFRFVSMITADLTNEIVLTEDEKRDLHKEITDKLNELYKKAKEILTERSEDVLTLAKALEEHRILSKVEIQEILAASKGSTENSEDGEIAEEEQVEVVETAETEQTEEVKEG